MKLKHLVVVTVITLLLLLSEALIAYMPLVAALQDLNSDAQPANPGTPSVARLVLHPGSGIAILVLALACLAASVRGARKGSAWRVWSILLAVANALALFGACMALFVAPKFMVMFKDMGFK